MKKKNCVVIAIAIIIAIVMSSNQQQQDTQQQQQWQTQHQYQYQHHPPTPRQRLSTPTSTTAILDAWTEERVRHQKRQHSSLQAAPNNHSGQPEPQLPAPNGYWAQAIQRSHQQKQEQPSIPRQSRTEAVVQRRNETTLSPPNIPTYYEGESDDVSNGTYCYSNIEDSDSDASHSSRSHYSTENDPRYQ